MLEKAIQRLQAQIHDSKLKEVIAAELKELLAEKPSHVTTDQFIAAAAIIILKDLRTQLLPYIEQETEPASSSVTDRMDCGKIISGLLVGMHNELLESNLQMVKALGSAIAERDSGTSDHNYRVAIYTVRLAEQLGLDTDGIRALIKGSFLHDIGKIGIRDGLLLKPGNLTAPEYETVKRHVMLGMNIIEHVKWLEDASDVILYHHEKWDGTGYLKGLRETEIPLHARIFSIADVFDALTSERPYKQRASYNAAVAVLKNESGARFDPILLNIFLEISDRLYREVNEERMPRLEDILTDIIKQYFRFNPSINDLRDKINSPGVRTEN